MNTIMKTSMIIWFILSATIKMNAQYSDVHCKQHPQSMQITQIDYREYSTITVSYTHLTLPTILRV